MRHRGDSGDTSLFDGARVRKTDPRIAAIGDVDELNSVVGLAIALGPGELASARLAWTQERLLRLGAELANPGGRARSDVIRDEDVATLNEWLLGYRDTLPALENFVLPGGTPAAAAVQLARATCRRAERSAFGLTAAHPVQAPALVFLNRLSDVLFEMARAVNAEAGVGDTRWLGPRQRDHDRSGG